MTGFPIPFALAMLAVAAAAVIAILHTLAERIKHERDVHELRLRVHDVRTAYAQRLADLAAREHGGVEEAPSEHRQAA